MPTGQEILSRAATLLNDADHIRWPLPQMCEWLNEGVRAIVLAKPSASSASMVLDMQVGTLQNVPQAGTPKPLSLISINRNITDATEPRKGGRMIKHTDRGLLDAAEPNWHDRSRVQFRKEVRQYCFDELLPLQYYVFPGNDGTGKVEAVVGTLPAPVAVYPVDADPLDIASYNVDVGLPEPYSVPLLDYVLYRCQMVDDIDGAAGRSAIHYQQFATAIGLKIQVEKAHSPNARPA